MKRDGAFTLIELLVVVGIITLLLAILLPSLGKARAQARAAKCGASLRSVGQGVAAYLTESGGFYPPSYVYPDVNGNWTPQNQIHPPANGYLHWSSFLIGYVKDSRAFTCPEFQFGGVPKTDPGPVPTDWVPGQSDENGAAGPNSAVNDQQAAFCAFTVNAAIMSRNKFTDADRESDPSTAGGVRVNVPVNATSITDASSSIILATEFNSNWQTIAQTQGNGYKALGHRPIMPFGLLGSSNEFAVPLTGFYTYVSATSLMNLATLNSQTAANYSLISDQVQLNAVGRNHPGSSSANGQSMGGTSNFLYVDGHVERKSLVETLNAREWGSRFYSMGGNNTVQ